ncbi:MAG: putative dsRNA-binding protein, partial [Cyanobacteriota bacterium]|nr:putative dsRNA-binding protein [Cyanobacteriota bacterium]
ALLGGIYLAWGGPAGGLAPLIGWLTPHWRKTAATVLADPHRQNWKSALQEWSQRQGMGLPRYSCQERSLAHGDEKRFYCQVELGTETSGNSKTSPNPFRKGPLAEGWGRSRRRAEQEAARQALQRLNP